MENKFFQPASTPNNNAQPSSNAPAPATNNLVKPDPEMLNVLVMEDHPLMVEAIVDLFKGGLPPARFTVLSELDGLIDVLKRERFDLAMLDLMISGTISLNAIETIKSFQSDIKILVVSSYEDRLYAKRCYLAGADGYCNKRMDKDMFLNALKMVISGNMFFQKDAMDGLRYAHAPTIGNDGVFASLSSRELEIAMLLISGMSPNAIASMINVSKSTISTHKANLYKKLNVKGLIELKRLADSNGFHA